jgi:hypothetical protein
VLLARLQLLDSAQLSKEPCASVFPGGSNF